MRNKVLFWGILATAAVTLFSCNKIEPVIETEQPDNNGIPFEIRILGDNTKTTNLGLSTLWESGDAINLFHASSSSGPYTSDGQFQTSTDGSNVTFSGTLETALSSGSYYWYAIFPYNSNITTPKNTGKKGYVTVGSAKTGAQNQVGVSNMNHIAGTNYPLAGISGATAHDATPTFSMYHLTTLMAVEITNGSGSPITVTNISLSSESEDIVGTYFIDFTGDNPAFTKSGDDYVGNTATLTVSSGNINAGETGTFYLAVKPFTAEAGDDFTLSVTTAEFGEQASVKQPTAAMTFVAGKINTLRFTYTNNTLLTLPEVDNSSTPYTVGFEDAEGFTATTTYNNTTEKQDGAADREWNILSGSVSTTGALAGSNSMLMRDYTANGFAPYVSTAFKLKSLKYITFKAKAKTAGYDLQLYYSTDNGVNWTPGDSFTLTTNTQVYSTTFASTLSGAAIKFAVVLPDPRTNKSDVWIDDVEFCSTAPTPSVTPATSAASSYENTANGTTATLNGTITLEYGAVIGDVSEYGFKYKIGDGSYTTVAGALGSPSSNVYPMSAAVTGLTTGTQVTYYAYVVYGGNTINGSPTTFTPTKAASSSVLYLTNAEIIATMTANGPNSGSYGDITFESASGDWPAVVYRKNDLTYIQLRAKDGAKLCSPTFSSNIDKVVFTINSNQSTSRTIHLVPSATDVPTSGSYTSTLWASEYGSVATGTGAGEKTISFTSNANSFIVVVEGGATYIDSIEVFLK